MTARPTHNTAAGRAYLDLQNLARRQGRPTDELHQIYALEGFLARLTVSEYADRLVLKGGVLLAAYDTRRPTRDVDLQAQRTPNDADTVLAMVKAIVDMPLDDGLVYHAADATAAFPGPAGGSGGVSPPAGADGQMNQVMWLRRWAIGLHEPRMAPTPRFELVSAVMRQRPARRRAAR